MENASNPSRGSAFHYLDFELEILPGTEHDYPVRVINSPEGQAQATMRFPFDEPALEIHLGDLRAALRSSADQRRHLVPPGEESEQDRVRSFGQGLFDALFTGEVRDNYYLSRQKAEREHHGLRLKLRIEAPELATVPWEFLYDAREPDYVCLSVDTPLVRYLPIPRTVRPLAVEPPLRILGMIACPKDLRALDTEREKRRVEEAVKGLQARGWIELVWLEGPTSRHLQRAMRGGPWHVFHFIGHGGFDPRAGQGFIALADEEGKSDRLRAVSLGRLLADHESLRLAVLNSCQGAKGSERDVLSSTAAALVRRGIPAVLAMQYEISDAAAIQLARSFYEGLVEGMPVDAAVAEARKLVSVAEDTVEWGTPVLFMRGEGRIFEVTGEPKAKPQEEKPPIVDEALEQRLGQLYLDGREAALLENWEKAYRKFREVVGLRPDYRDAADQLEQAKAQRRWQKWYEEAQAAQEAGDWDAAAKTLKKLVKEAPNFQDAGTLLQKVEDRGRLAGLYEEARQFHALQKWQAVIKVWERIRELDAEYPDPDGLLATASEGLQALERQRKVEALYEQGLQHLEAQEWSEALDAFEEIEHLEPGYRESDALLAQARDKVQEGKREQEWAQLYQQAQAAMKAKERPAAIKALEEVLAGAPDYRDASDLLEAAKAQQMLAELYAEARRLQRAGQWQAVVDVFDQIKAIDAQYPDAEGLLAEAQRKLAEPVKPVTTPGVPQWLWLAGAVLVVGIIIIKLLGGGGKVGGQATPTPRPTYTRTTVGGRIALTSPTYTLTPTRTPPRPTATPTPTLTRTPRALTATPTPTCTSRPPTLTPTPAREPQAGATKVLGQTGITLVYVPAGEFLMGSTDSDPDAEPNEKPQHLVYLDGYWIGKTEVTNAQYRQFVEDGGYSKAEYWSEEGWQWREGNGITEPSYWTDPAWNGADYPVVDVSWYEASAYARWAGARLPTEAEWEKAARGTDGRLYPWGNEWDDSRANVGSGDRIGDTTPVGHYSPRGDSPYGVADMAGNAWEWTQSLYKGYPYDPDDGREDLESGADRVVRGGSFNIIRDLARCASRTWNAPVTRWYYNGFRVVVSPV